MRFLWRLMKKHKILFFCYAISFILDAKQPFIVGLMPVRNESAIIDQSLRALACYTDAIVVLDDASEDNTLAIIESLATECKIKAIIKKTIWHRDEPGDKNLLLKAGRELGGTHFIVIDADEMFTANFAQNNFLKNLILRLNPGDRLAFYMFHIWKHSGQYRHYEPAQKEMIFCDDGISGYNSDFIHTPRVPISKQGALLILENCKYGIMHFEPINFRNLRIKYAWYMCLHKIRKSKFTDEQLNEFYAQLLDDSAIALHATHADWFAYPFYDEKAYHASRWEEQHVIDWIKEYGRDYFASLAIWDVDAAWTAGSSGTFSTGSKTPGSN